MKKILIFLFCILFEIDCCAQHIKFLGIPLGCHTSIFKQKLIEKGFEYDSEISDKGGYSGSIVFWGKFSGENAIIAAQYTPKSFLIARVEVQYCGYSKWPYLNNTREDQVRIFEDRERAIISKYGNPTDRKTTEQYYRLTKWNFTDGLIALLIERMKGNPSIWGMYVVYDDKLSIEQFLRETNEDF